MVPVWKLRVRYIIALFISLPVVVFGFWLIAVPESAMTDALEGALGADSVYLKAEGLKKGLFYDFSADRIFLMKKGSGEYGERPLVMINGLRGRLDFISLIKFAPALKFEGTAGKGVVSGEVGIMGNSSLEVRGGGIAISEIPFLESFGISGEGLLSGDCLTEGKKGEIRLSLTDARLGNTYIGDAFLPLSLFDGMKAAVAIVDGAAEVKSFAMSGKGVYGRIKGRIMERRMDMSLELMADSSYSAPIPLQLVERYKVSPGYYVIPLKGELPQIR